jgi:hypothetical protein
MIFNVNDNVFDISKKDYDLSIKIIKDNINEFDQYRRENQKLRAVKKLKESSNLGLRESKEIIDIFYEDKLFPNIKEERLKKLEKLAKKPLISEIINKIKNIDNNDLENSFFKLSIDDLFNINEALEEFN